ncbi:DUF4265 domain-containing protein [Streptomyces sp. AK02-01A]|uniref:DUF4265 domain-containing protein n=1 Tax=Streptomyces sp. AK02-01A TaxID=3028648 RepID=UPI0029A7C9FE|nr:DUF4265 domain-containing protein [Streptomyces sp. AK02-01A]MDX3854164.1 DUF4265 domain-containing protein [Streptomyces sp. AK02-01A]
MTDVTGEHVKVLFPLDQDEDGWPPVSTEGLWAVRLDGDAVRIDNTPWFVTNVACGDIVRVNEDVDGQLRAVEKVKWSGNCPIRVIPFRDGRFEGELSPVIELFAPVGVTGEGLAQFGLVALNVPGDVDLATVQELLWRGSDEGWWDFDEGCVGDAWTALQSR